MSKDGIEHDAQTRDVGGDSISRDEFIFWNVKRTDLNYQDLDVERARSNNAAYNVTVQAGAAALANAMQVLAQGFQNQVVAVNAANNDSHVTTDLVGKQAVAHRDIAVDAEWNDDAIADAVVARGGGRIMAGEPEDVVDAGGDVDNLVK